MLQQKSQDYFGDLRNILSQTQRILEFDTTKLLDRETVQGVSRASEALYDAGEIEPSDAVLILRLYQLSTGQACRKEGVSKKYRYVFVDESQDYGPVDLATLIGSIEHVKGLTLVGDAGQDISQQGTFPGWKILAEHWDMDHSLTRSVAFTVSHRSTLPIMKFADAVHGSARTTDGREGRAPIWFVCRDEQRGVKEALNWLERVFEKFPGTLTAVLCGNPSEARHVTSLLTPTFQSAVRSGEDEQFSFEEGIVVTDVRSVKGLEFPNVLLWNPSKRVYPDHQRSRNALYVALTRAEELVCLVTWGEHSPVLPSPHSKLVRSVIQEPDPVEERD